MIEAIVGLSATSAVGGTQLTASQTAFVPETKNVGFTEALKETAMNQLETVKASEQATMGAMNGETSLQEVVQATVEAEMAVETALAIRNKLIESYQEIMRMPI